MELGDGKADSYQYSSYIPYTFLESYDDPMALVYNKKDVWSDIEKESSGLTEAIGAAIEQYYSTRYLPWSNSQKDGQPNEIWDSHLLN